MSVSILPVDTSYIDKIAQLKIVSRCVYEIRFEIKVYEKTKVLLIHAFILPVPVLLILKYINDIALIDINLQWVADINWFIDFWQLCQYLKEHIFYRFDDIFQQILILSTRDMTCQQILTLLYKPELFANKSSISTQASRHIIQYSKPLIYSAMLSGLDDVFIRFTKIFLFITISD